MDCEHNKHMNIDGKAKWCMDCGAIKPCNFEIWSSPKAPKNELLPIKYSELIKLMIEKGSPKIGESRVKLARNIIAKFGSSGKRHLNEQEVIKILESANKESPYWSDQKTFIAKAICKEFSTAEVSANDIFKIINDCIGDLYIPFEVRNNLAKAIKRELEKK